MLFPLSPIFIFLVFPATCEVLLVWCSWFSSPTISTIAEGLFCLTFTMAGKFVITRVKEGVISAFSPRFYKIEGFASTELYPSVTTVLEMINKPYLRQWDTRTALESVRTQLTSQQGNGLASNPEWLDGVLKRAGTHCSFSLCGSCH